MTKGTKAGLLVLGLGAIALTAIYVAFRPAPSAPMAAMPAPPSTTASTKKAHVAELVRIYEAGRALEPRATYAERQRARTQAIQELQREDPAALQTAIRDEAQADGQDARRRVDRMMAEEAARQH